MNYNLNIKTELKTKNGKINKNLISTLEEFIKNKVAEEYENSDMKLLLTISGFNKDNIKVSILSITKLEEEGEE